MQIRGPRGFDGAERPQSGPQPAVDADAAAIDAEARAAAEKARAPKMRGGGSQTLPGEGKPLPEPHRPQAPPHRADGKKEPPLPPNDKWRLLPKAEQVRVEDLPVPKDVKDVHFDKVDGPLFTDGISPEDIVQNTVGDCYFVSALAAVAGTHPEIIRDMVKENGDGTFDVTFKDPDTGKPLEPIHVDARLPFGKDAESGEEGIVGASVKRPGQAQNELWVAVIEKAYATLRGGYKRIGKGGNGDETLPVITGAQTPLIYLATYEKKGRTDLVWSRLTEASEKKWPTVASTPTSDEEEELDEKTGILSGHVYTILGAEERDGKKILKIRNPHGQTEPDGDGVDDGIFELPFEKFLESFEDVSVAKVAA